MKEGVEIKIEVFIDLWNVRRRFRAISFDELACKRLR